jgi:hypothetical protein
MSDYLTNLAERALGLGLLKARRMAHGGFAPPLEINEEIDARLHAGREKPESVQRTQTVIEREENKREPRPSSVENQSASTMPEERASYTTPTGGETLGSTQRGEPKEAVNAPRELAARIERRTERQGEIEGSADRLADGLEKGKKSNPAAEVSEVKGVSERVAQIPPGRSELVVEHAVTAERLRQAPGENSATPEIGRESGATPESKVFRRTGERSTKEETDVQEAQASVTDQIPGRPSKNSSLQPSSEGGRQRGSSVFATSEIEPSEDISGKAPTAGRASWRTEQVEVRGSKGEVTKLVQPDEVPRVQQHRSSQAQRTGEPETELPGGLVRDLLARSEELVRSQNTARGEALSRELERSGAPARREAAPPTVEVTIGRLEIRGAASHSPMPSRQRPATKSLKQYLRRRALEAGDE